MRMIWLALLALLIGVIGLIARTKKDQLIEELKLATTLFGFGGIVAGLALLGASALTVIPSGHVGVPVVFGKVANRSIPEGLNVVNPFAIVVKMSVRTETYTMSSEHNEGTVKGDDAIKALSKDGLALPLDITAAFRLVAKDAPWIYRNLGQDYVNSILRPASRTAIRDATSRYTFQECYSTKREELSQTMEDLLIKRVKDLIAKRIETEGIIGFAIDQVMLRNVAPPPKVKTAIEMKLAAEQDAQRMEFVLLKERKEAERKEIEAGGIRNFQLIVTQGLTPSYLTWKGIETTRLLSESPNAKIVVIGAGDKGLPIILGGN